MSMDHRGRRTTQVARAAVHVLIAVTIVGLSFVLVGAGASVFGSGRAPFPELFLIGPILVILAGLVSLRLFLNDVLAGSVFTKRNARRLSFIGWLMIAFGLFRFLPVLITVITGGTGVIGIFFVFGQPILAAGLLVLVIAAAWRYGSELQQDRDLTV